MDLLHDIPTWLISLVLLVLMFAANAFGYRMGIHRSSNESEQSRNVSTALKASVFGLVAFLLGFSFSMTSSRHDLRRRITLDEANAIGTCYLRAGLLADPERTSIRGSLKSYVDVRLRLFEKAHSPAELQNTLQEMNRLMTAVWSSVEEATKKSPESVRTSQIVPATNDVIDLSSTRDWAVRNHLPLSVALVLLTCVLVSSLLLGHSSGQSGVRHTGLWIAFNALFALVMFTILDFDRPRRGLVQVDHSPLVELKRSIGTP